IGNPLETAIAFSSLAFGGVLDRLPDLSLLLAHGGGFATMGLGRLDHGHRVRPEAQTLADAMPSDYLRRIYIDSLTHSGEMLAFLVHWLGADRVVLGTDYPADMGQLDPVTWIEDIDAMTHEQRRLVL